MGLCRAAVAAALCALVPTPAVAAANPPPLPSPLAAQKPQLTEARATAIFLARDKVADWVGRYWLLHKGTEEIASPPSAARNDRTKKQIPPGDDLLSQRCVPPVPSALTGLTSGFGMGPGVSPPLKSPEESVFKKPKL